jgi:hypothetical protein
MARGMEEDAASNATSDFSESVVVNIFTMWL